MGCSKKQEKIRMINIMKLILNNFLMQNKKIKAIKFISILIKPLNNYCAIGYTALLLLLLPAFAFANKWQPIIHLINQRIPKILTTHNASGAAVALVNENGIVWSHAYGYLSYKHQHKVNRKTIFSMESDSKMFTATGVLIAAQNKLIDLNKPISSYLPNFNINNRFSDINPLTKITLKNLLSHTAGLPHEAPVGNNYLNYSPSFDAHINSIQNTWLRYPVGQRFAYSNLGIDLAGYILQLKSQMPFVQYMQQYVLNPLAMKMSSFSMDKIRQNKNRAIGTIPGVKKVPLVIPMLPSGGLYSNILDIAKFIQFQLNDGKVQGKQLLQKRYIALMRTIPYPLQGQKYGYALGISKVKFGNVIDYNHNGSGFGFNSTINWCPQYHFGFVILFNGIVTEKMNDLTIAIFKKIGQQPNLNYDTVVLKHTIKHSMNMQQIKCWQGNYIGRGSKLKLILKNKKLIATFDGNEAPLIYLGHNEYYSKKLKQLYRFIPATKHQASYIIQLSNGQTWDYNDGPKDSKGPNKKQWKQYVGKYQMKNDIKAKIMVHIYIKHGWLYLDNYKLREFQKGLFTSCDGKILDLRKDQASWNNIPLKQVNKTSKRRNL